MKGLKDSALLGVGAIGVAMFSLGFSVTGVACNTRPHKENVARAEYAASERPSATLTMPEITIVPSAAGNPTNPAPAEAKVALATPDNKRGLRIKRLIVTTRIVEHEPVIGESLSLARGPIYAFAELENTSQGPQTIEITFERENGSVRVGHAKLEIPGNRERFRTWGNTRNIREPGRWQAVVRTVDGIELARTDFEVEST